MCHRETLCQTGTWPLNKVITVTWNFWDMFSNRYEFQTPKDRNNMDAKMRKTLTWLHIFMVPKNWKIYLRLLFTNQEYYLLCILLYIWWIGNVQADLQQLKSLGIKIKCSREIWMVVCAEELSMGCSAT